ncbi:MAG: hypothetical protein QM783_14325 [Phycisphaerales bacterium]
MDLTLWDRVQVLLLFALVPLLAAIVLLVVVRLIRPLAVRYPIVRLASRAAGVGVLTILLLTAAWFVLAAAVELFGENGVLAWGPTVGLLAVGVGFYAWGRLAWRVRREQRIGPRCPKCRYDLKGLTLSDARPCPECGRKLPAALRGLYQTPVRKWATRLGVLLVVVGLLGPPAWKVYRSGWMSVVPNWAVLRMLVWNVQTRAVLDEMQKRRLWLGGVDPHWTHELMASFADEYDAAAAGGKTPPWMIYNRFYLLYQVGRDPETLRLAESWVSGPSIGRRFAATGMMSVEGFCPKEDRLRLLRPLLADPDVGVRSNALRALTFDAALPLDELLAFQKSGSGKLWSGEVNGALRRYNDASAVKERLRLAADTTDPWADHVTWGLIYEGFDFTNGGYTDGMFRRLADAKAVYPTARTAWTQNSAVQQFRQVYARLAERAAGKVGTEGEDPTTAAWCLGALKSYATTTPIRGSMVMSVEVVGVIDGLLAKEPAGPYRDRLLGVREAIAPGDGASAPSPGEEMGRGR